MNNKYSDRVAMKLNVRQLDNIIIALINNPFNKKFVGNVNQLFKILQPRSYENDGEKVLRVYIVRNITKLILENNFNDKSQVISSLTFDGKYASDADILMESLKDAQINDGELSLLDKLISNQLKYKSLDENASELSELLGSFQAEDYDDMDTMISEIESKISVMNKEMKSARESINDTKKDMNLSSSSFINTLDRIIQEERNPASKVKTGIQYLNSMLNGGFAKGRLYLACGMAKGGKSAFLLECALWAKRYNSFITKDPEKTPVIVYLSMENTNEETVGRIWNYCFGDESELKTFDKAEAAAMLEKAGIFTPNNPKLPELQLWYRSNRSINAADIAGMLDDLEKQGKECVFLIVDYLARMKAVEFNKEQRLELSNVTNDLKTLANDYDIPVLSAHQLNREAFRQCELAETFEEKIKASNTLGVSQIGDSIDVVRNCDVAFIVNRIQNVMIGENENDPIIDRYLFIKLIASRMKMPKITSFQHRFKDGNGMALIDDINATKPFSTKTETELARSRIEGGQKTTGKRTIA